MTFLVLKIEHGRDVIDNGDDGASRALFVADSALRLRARGCSTRGKDPRNKGGRSPLTRDPALDPRRG